MPRPTLVWHLKDWAHFKPLCGLRMRRTMQMTENPTKVTCKRCVKSFLKRPSHAVVSLSSAVA